jgi:hypothetical protein
MTRMNSQAARSKSMIRLSLAAFVLAVIAGGDSVQAQSCVTPIPVFFPGPLQANTCNSSNQVTSTANGMLDMPGQDVVYKVTLGASVPYVTFTLQPNAATDLSLSVCRFCGGVSASCIEIADSHGAGGLETIYLPQPAAGDYYVIVDSVVRGPPIGCGAFTLTTTAPLVRLADH